MKKILLLAFTAILTACSGGADTVKDLTTKINEGTTNYRITVNYTESGETEASDEYTYIASEKAFDVKSSIVNDDTTYSITYKTSENGNKIENLKVIDQDGEEYDVNENDYETYSDIMKDQVMYEIDFMEDLTSGIYENVSKSDDEKSYNYIVTNTNQKDTYEIYKDLSGFVSVIDHENGEVVTTTLTFL